MTGGGLHLCMQWYYAIDGQRLGPVPHDELERLVQAGTLRPDSLLWRQGMDQWKTLAEVRERDPALFASEPPPPLPESAVSLDKEDVSPVVRRVPGFGTEEKPGVSEELIYAGFWRRAGAFVVDAIIWLFVWEILSNILLLVVFPEMADIRRAVTAAGGFMTYKPTPEHLVVMAKAYPVIMLIGVVWAVTYDSIFLRRFSATPGKLLLGLQVVQVDGTALGLGRIVSRTLLKGVAGLPTIFIGFLIVAFDDQKRGLHDFFCRTRVIKKR